MDDRKIRMRLKEALGNSDAKISKLVLRELREVPLDRFEDLPEHEKSIAISAFIAAASTRQTMNESPLDLDVNAEAFSKPTLGENRTRTGITAATAALLRIPEKQRSTALTQALEECTCNPTPLLP